MALRLASFFMALTRTLKTVEWCIEFFGRKACSFLSVNSFIMYLLGVRTPFRSFPNPLAGDFLSVQKQRRLISDIPSNPGSRSEFVETTATTILSFKYAGGVLVAGDRRATAGNVVMYDRADKVLEIDRHSVMAIAGSPAIAWEMARILEHSFQFYRRSQLQEMSVEGKVRTLSKFGCAQGLLLRRHGCPIRSHDFAFKWLRSACGKERALLRKQLGFETVART